MRDVETIDSELRLLAAVRRSIRDHGGDRQVARSTNCLMSGLAHCGQRESGVLELSSTKRVVHYSMSAPVSPETIGSESQLSRADYPRPTGRKVP